MQGHFMIIDDGGRVVAARNREHALVLGASGFVALAAYAFAVYVGERRAGIMRPPLLVASPRTIQFPVISIFLESKRFTSPAI